MYKPSRDEYLCAPKKCTKMFIMALFITEKKTGNNPKSINNRIRKLYYIVTMEFYTQ